MVYRVEPWEVLCNLKLEEDMFFSDLLRVVCYVSFLKERIFKFE